MSYPMVIECTAEPGTRFVTTMRKGTDSPSRKCECAGFRSPFTQSQGLVWTTGGPMAPFSHWSRSALGEGGEGADSAAGSSDSVRRAPMARVVKRRVRERRLREERRLPGVVELASGLKPETGAGADIRRRPVPPGDGLAR